VQRVDISDRGADITLRANGLQTFLKDLACIASSSAEAA
jgi:hypothetical protein